MSVTSRPQILALIPARGGSKSIPRKNLLMLAGKPLLSYTIQQALASRLITRTVVSTDDTEIADVARDYGAEVPFMRPAALAGDASTDLEVFSHVLGELRKREGYQCELVVHLRPTGPVRRVARIDEAIERLLARPDADSLRSVTTPEQSPYKMWRVADGWLQPIVPTEGELHSLPRQMLPPVFWQNGYVDVVRPSAVLEQRSMSGRRVLPFVVNEPVYELDYPEHIARVEAALAVLSDQQDHLAEPAAALRRDPV